MKIDTKIKADLNSTEIMKLVNQTIDEAMTKKNRSVSMFICNGHVKMDIYPYTETTPHWIEKKGDKYISDRYICSECGFAWDHISPHCPMCGEQLNMNTEVPGEPKV